MTTRVGIPARTPVEVAFLDLRGDTQTITGRFLSWYDDLRIETGRGIRTIANDRVRYCSPMREETMVARLRVGDSVYVRKYGGTYAGKVTKLGRTRVTVAIRLRSGRTREHAYNAADVSA